jgi:uncharacterized DUF497 family protein
MITWDEHKRLRNLADHGDVPHVISARKAVKHEEQAWHWRYLKRP